MKLIRTTTLKKAATSARRYRADLLVMLNRGRVIHKQFKRQRALEPWQKRYKRRAVLAGVPLLIVSMIVNMLLPAMTARAEEVLTWSTNADFSFNKAGKCQATEIDKFVVSGDEYTDDSCASLGADSDLTLAPDESSIQGVVAAATGGEHSVALKNDGTVWAWGYNNYGQIGQGTTGAQEKFPLQVKDSSGSGFLTDVKAIAAGQYHSVALKNDGTVWTWGSGSSGRLGYGSTASKSLPVQVLATASSPLTDIVSISAGMEHNLALKNDGTVWAWGEGQYGRLGSGSTADLYRATQVKDAAGSGIMTSVMAISAGSEFSLLLKEDGTVWSFGYNQYYGALGDNTTADKYLPVQVKDETGGGFLANVTKIKAGSRHSLVIKGDGSVWAWGYNGSGTLGNNTTTTSYIPVRVKDQTGGGYLANVIGLGASNSNSYALLQDGRVLSWGYDYYGSLGKNSTNTQDRLLPAPVVDPATGGALQGVSVVEASHVAIHALAVGSNGVLYGWGKNENYQLGFRFGGAQRVSSVISIVAKVVTSTLSDVKKVDVGNYHSLVLKNDGTVWAWGNNGNGELGLGVTGGETVPLPTQVKDSTGSGYLTDVIDVSAGKAHSLALKNDGTVWAWGNGYYGALGTAQGNTSSNLPVQVKSSTGSGYLSGITAVHAGFQASIALKNDGTVWAWGVNDRGVLGKGDTGNSALPVQVKDAAGTGYLSGITDVSISNASQNYYQHAIARKNDGTVWAWGNNDNGQLGNDSVTMSALPVQVKDGAGTGLLTDVVNVDAAAFSSMALKSDGTVWAWGAGVIRGDGSNAATRLPSQVKDSTGTGLLTNVTSIFASTNSAYAISEDGSVWAWGANGDGNLGDGSTSNRYLPVRVKTTSAPTYLTGITSLSAGGSTVLAVTLGGGVLGWGNNQYAQLGSGNYQEDLTMPVTALASINYLSGFARAGSLGGLVFDIGAGKKTRWYGVSWNTDALPANTSVKFNVRTSDDEETWSDWSQDFTQTTAGSTSGLADIDSLPMSRFIELQATLATTDNAVTPKLNDFSLAYMVDNTAPDVNAANIRLSRMEGGSLVNQDGWIDVQTPYFTWDEGGDTTEGSGVQGYCLYLGTDASANLSQAKGILGDSPVDTGGVCQYAVSTNHLDLSVPGTLASPLAIADNPYHLLVRAIDYGANIYEDGDAASFTFNYDDTPPTNPVFVSAPSQFVSDKNVTLTWPASGDQSAKDDDSQVAGLQYRIGSDGTWYGDTHNGQQDLTDVLANDGSYVIDPTYDYPRLKDGNNVVYFRTIDHAGNISATYITAIIKINTTSPSSPLNVTATPTTNSTNSFAFSWHAPTSFVGQASGLTYCYTVNALPTANNCNYTRAGQTSLSADAFATQPGENVFYIVAEDEAGNINYATYGSVAFTANTPAPGMAQNIEIADISSKEAQLWKLAFSWAAPTNTGAGVAKYAIYRSTDGNNFSQVATTSGLSYVDSSLDQVTYYYKVKACDSANNCGAFSDVVSKLPTGRYTTPPELISDVSVEVSTKKASFAWVTDRNSDSRVQYGVKSGDYFAGEVAVSAETKVHSVQMDNLEAGTTYYYRVKWMDEDGNIGVSSEYTFSTLPAPVVKSVEVIKKTLSSATIKLTTLDATKISLYYGKSESFGGVTSVNTSRSESSYIVELTGLDDGSNYFFKIVTFDADGNEYDSRRIDSFATPPRPRISNLRFQPVEGEPTSTQSVTWTTNIPTSSTVTYGKTGTNGSDVYLSKLTTDHKIILRGLEDNSQYFLMAQSRDADGNVAASDRQYFKTALDTRPPKIYDIRIETSVKGNGSEARGQIVVSWKTDEPSTSQVAYAYGSTGDDFPSRTGEDAQLTTDHVVIVSDLAVSKVYHLVPISRDKSQNATIGEDRSAVIGRATDSILNIILNSLKGIFGL